MSALTFKMPKEFPLTTLLVSLALIGMLALFYSVVKGAVQAGEIRKQAMAAQTAGVLRCNALPNGNGTKACRKELTDPAAVGESALLATR